MNQNTHKRKARQAQKMSVSMHADLAAAVYREAAIQQCSVSRIVQLAVIAMLEVMGKMEPAKEGESIDESKESGNDGSEDSSNRRGNDDNSSSQAGTARDPGDANIFDD